MSQRNHRVEPERNGVLGRPFLTPTHRDEQAFDARTVLFPPGKVLTKGPDGAEQKFMSITAKEVV